MYLGMVMRTLNKILALIFLLSSSFVFAKDINDIEFGEFLTEEHLIELEPLHRGLSDYYDFKKNGLSGIFPDVYYWYHSDLGYEVKKIIHVIKGSNQVIVHKIEIEDPECIKFLRLFKNYYQTEKDIKMEDFDSIIGASWLEWSKKATFRITKNENLGIDFFSTNPKIDLERSKKVYCQDDILTLSEFGYEAEDEKNDWVQYTEHIKDFPMPNPFGHEFELLKGSSHDEKIVNANNPIM